jgi:arylsulfatase A-like enzyme
VLLLFALAPARRTHAAGAGKQPNVIIILADDVGYGEFGFQGISKDIPTPNIDSIAQGGVRFTRAMCRARTVRRRARG